MNNYLRNAATVTADQSHSTRTKMKINVFCLASAICACAYSQPSIQLPGGETVANTSVRSLAAAISAAAKANPGEVELTVEKVSARLGKGKKDFAKAEAITRAAVLVIPGKAVAIVKVAVNANPALACPSVVGAIAASPKAAAAVAQAAAAIVPEQAAAIVKAAVRAAPEQAAAIVAAVLAVTPSEFHDAIAAVIQEHLDQWNQWGGGGSADPTNIGGAPNDKNNNGKTVSDNQG